MSGSRLKTPACECGTPSEFVHVTYREIREHELWWQEHKKLPFAQQMIDATELSEIPQRAAWRFTCEAHAPDDGVYGFRCPATGAEWLRKVAHLLDTKEWVTDTDLGQTLYRVVGFD